ncbi:elongin A, like isoform X2 [Sardina pilchardus]|uniref:elongin A, like isoform X2 n=1 Tax=Sardina pilchardus TaxID=27697 RepID=UPI002E15E8F6
MAALKTVLELKLQLKSSEPKTVLKTLKKLQRLEITIDILAETGIGKLVNSFRKHNEAGEVARTLVTQWKKLIPKESPSKTKDKDSEKKSSRVEATEKTVEPEHSEQPEQQNGEIEPEIQKNSEARLSDKSVGQITDPNKNPEAKGTCAKDIVDSKSSKRTTRKETKTETASNPERKSNVLHSKGHTRTEKVPNDSKGQTDTSKQSNHNSNSKETKNKKNKTKRTAEKVVEKDVEIKNNENEEGTESHGMSFEAFLSYDMVSTKRKRSSDIKKQPSKRPKIIKSDDSVKTPSIKFHTECTEQPSKMGTSKNEILDLLNIPLPLTLPKCDDLSNYRYFEEKDPVADTETYTEEDSSVFTGQRSKKKMQVYSGTKSSSLPAMMSLYQQCLRALQNNIDSLYEVGGVPFEILEPVLERCTPEQLARIEEFNPVYIGVTDHLWERHCQRDFRSAQLQEYESWREMFFRLSEERERKLASLTKSIISAHSQKPRGRQVKMAFINCAAKPPRNVRAQQELYGTAGPTLQPHPLDRPRAPCQESKVKLVCREYPRPGTNNAGPSQAQDPRKIKRVAPMMAKSLKAFKEQRRRR